jgi:hypothetical protein
MTAKAETKPRPRWSWRTAAATAATIVLAMEPWPPAVRAILAGASVGMWLWAVIYHTGGN